MRHNSFIHERERRKRRERREKELDKGESLSVIYKVLAPVLISPT